MLRPTATLRPKILHFRGFDSSITLSILRGESSHVHRDFPGNLRSTNLSRDDLSREIGGRK